MSEFQGQASAESKLALIYQNQAASLGTLGRDKDHPQTSKRAAWKSDVAHRDRSAVQKGQVDEKRGVEVIEGTPPLKYWT